MKTKRIKVEDLQQGQRFFVGTDIIRFKDIPAIHVPGQYAIREVKAVVDSEINGDPSGQYCAVFCHNAGGSTGFTPYKYGTLVQVIEEPHTSLAEQAQEAALAFELMQDLLESRDPETRKMCSVIEIHQRAAYAEWMTLRRQAVLKDPAMRRHQRRLESGRCAA